METKALLEFEMPQNIYDFTLEHFNMHKKIIKQIISSGYSLDMIYLKELLFGEFDMIRYDDEIKFEKSINNPTSELVPLLVLRKKGNNLRLSPTCGVWVELHKDGNPF